MANHPNRARSDEEEDKKLPTTTGTAVQIVDFGGLGGLGTEDLGIDDLPTPLLQPVHYQCPQIMRGDPKYIPGAVPGMIFDVSVGEAWDGEKIGLDVLVCGVKKRYQEWIPRTNQLEKEKRQLVRVRSGNFRGFREVNDPVVQRLLAKHNRFMPLPWTNEDRETVDLIECGELFVMFAPPPLTASNARRAMVNFKSTALKEWTSYNGRHGNAKFVQPNGRSESGPLCIWRWRLRTQPTQHAENPAQRWFIFRLDLSSWVDQVNAGVKDPVPNFLDNQVHVQDPELFEMAVKSLQQYKLGAVKEYRPDDEGGSDDGSAGPALDPEAPPF